MFITNEEIMLRKEQAEERVREIIGKEYIYWHTVGAGSGASDEELGIAGTEVVIAGFRYQNEDGPFEVDLAVQTRTEDLHVLLTNVQVQTGIAHYEGEQHVIFVEWSQRERIEKACEAYAQTRLVPAGRRPNHLSLVVDNENTVERLASELYPHPILEVVVPPPTPFNTEEILQELGKVVGRRWMPSSTLDTYGATRSPIYLKAADDGDFVRMMLAFDNSGLYKRDALRSTEIWAVLPMENFNILVGLQGKQVLMGARGTHRAYEWIERTLLDRDLLVAAIKAL